MSRRTLVRLGRALYPFLQAELFLPWTEDEFADRVDRIADVFVREGLLSQTSEDEGGVLQRSPGQSDEVFRLRAIGHTLQQAFERYYIAISVLVKNGPGTLGAAELESLCQLAAQRLSLLYAPAAPEFFDKSLFRGFIQKLREMRLVWPDQNSKLLFDERLDAWAKDAKLILGRELRHTIERVSPEAVQPAEAEAPPADCPAVRRMAGLPVIRPFQAGVPGGPGRPTRSQLHPRVSAATAAASGDACARPAAARPRPCQTAPNGCLDFAGAPSGAGQAGRCAAAGRDAGTRKGTTPVRNLARASSRPPCPPAPARPPRA